MWRKERQEDPQHLVKANKVLGPKLSSFKYKQNAKNKNTVSSSTEYQIGKYIQ